MAELEIHLGFAEPQTHALNHFEHTRSFHVPTEASEGGEAQLNNCFMRPKMESFYCTRYPSPSSLGNGFQTLENRSDKRKTRKRTTKIPYYLPAFGKSQKKKQEAQLEKIIIFLLFCLYH